MQPPAPSICLPLTILKTNLGGLTKAMKRDPSPRDAFSRLPHLTGMHQGDRVYLAMIDRVIAGVAVVGDYPSAGHARLHAPITRDIGCIEVDKAYRAHKIASTLVHQLMRDAQQDNVILQPTGFIEDGWTYLAPTMVRQHTEHFAGLKICWNTHASGITDGLRPYRLVQADSLSNRIVHSAPTI